MSGLPMKVVESCFNIRSLHSHINEEITVYQVTDFAARCLLDKALQESYPCVFPRELEFGPPLNVDNRRAYLWVSKIGSSMGL